MHCRSCEVLLQDVLSEYPGIFNIKISHYRGTITFCSEKVISLPEIKKIITKNGYTIGQTPRSFFTTDPAVRTDVAITTIVITVVWIILTTTDIADVFSFSVERASWFSWMLVVWLIAWFSSCMAVVGWVILSLAGKWSQEHQQQTSFQKFIPQAYFHGGRLLWFALFGWLLGLLWSALQINDRGYMILFVIVWIIMLLSGLQLTQLFPRIASYHIWFPQGIQKYLRKWGKDRWMYIESGLAGMATFFLPCWFTIIAQAYAAATGDFFLWSFVMVGFALWTLPGLLSIGWLTTVLQWRWGKTIFRWLWVLLVLFSLYNFGLAKNYIIALQPSASIIGTQTVSEDEKPLVQISLVQDARGYTPDRITIPKNSKIELSIDSQDQYTCASSFWIPSKDVRTLLNPWNNVISFSTDNEDEIIFGCSMMMYRWQFLVQ